MYESLKNSKKNKQTAKLYFNFLQSFLKSHVDKKERKYDEIIRRKDVVRTKNKNNNLFIHNMRVYDECLYQHICPHRGIMTLCVRRMFWVNFYNHQLNYNILVPFSHEE